MGFQVETFAELKQNRSRTEAELKLWLPPWVLTLNVSNKALNISNADISGNSHGCITGNKVTLSLQYSRIVAVRHLLDTIFVKTQLFMCTCTCPFLTKGFTQMKTWGPHSGLVCIYSWVHECFFNKNFSYKAPVHKNRCQKGEGGHLREHLTQGAQPSASNIWDEGKAKEDTSTRCSINLVETSLCKQLTDKQFVVVFPLNLHFIMEVEVACAIRVAEWARFYDGFMVI